MYRILHKAFEDLPAVRRGPDLRVDNVSEFAFGSSINSYRNELMTHGVSLPESTASWAGSDAFEVRWTSLAA